MSTKQVEQTEKRRRTRSKTDSREKETEVKKRVNKRAKSIDDNERKIARVRIFPLWLRIIVVFILAAFALVAGLMIGYGVLGDGAPLDALKVETWRHLVEIVTKVE